MPEVTLKPPQDLRTDEPKRMSFDLAKGSPVSDDKIKELERQVKLTLEDQKQNTSVLRRRLQTLNDLLEGVVQEVSYPFPNASNVDTKGAVGTARTFRSTLIRALFSDPDRTFVASIPEEARREEANKVEDSFNWQAAHENGLVDALKDSVIPIFRDGTAFLQGIWDKRVEKVIDYRTYLTVEDFLVDYPDPESAGLSEEKFTEIIQGLAAPEAYLDVCFERDMTRKDGAVFSVVSLARFVWWPLSARSMDECEIYGVRMVESEATMKKKKKTGEYKESAAEACLTAVKEGSVDDLWDRSRDFIEGITGNSTASKRKEFENYRLVITIDLDDDDIPEKYMGVYNLAAGRFLNFDRYRVRNNIDFLVPLRFDRRDDRLLGRSLLYDGMDLFQEVNDIHRHRNNARMITDAPGFKAEDDLKDAVEQGLIEWHPGSIVWVPKGRMNGLEQFAIQNRSNTQNSMDEESLLSRAIEFIIGPTQGLSGQETKGDAGAPATKHLSKIRQAGYRLDDYIDELKRSFPDLGKLALALYYMYGPHKMAYQAKDDISGDMVSGEVERGLYGIDGITLDLNARSVIMSPEFEMERIMAVRAEAAQNPYIMAMKPQILGILWDRFIAAARLQNPEELKLGELAMAPLPTPPAPGGPAGQPAGPAQPSRGVGTGVPPLKALVESLGIGGATERRREV